MHRRYILLFLIMFSIRNSSGDQMSDQHKTQSLAQSAWIAHVKNNVATKKAGQFTAHDKSGRAVTIEWKATSITSPDCAKIMQGLADVACAAYVSVELKFLRIFPGAVSTDEFHTSLAPLFAHGVEAVDWHAVESAVAKNLKGIYEMDFSRFGEDIIKRFVDDVYFFVTVADKATGTLLGFITFSVTPAFGAGDVKVISLAINPVDQNRGLAKLLMSAIFTVLPDVRRIFLSTRITNEQAINAYRAWGFIDELNPIKDPHHTFNPKHWIFMEYKAGQSDSLQKIAQTMVK